jgi:hypothetical protein
VLALAAWQRDDVHDAMHWLGGDITLFESPIWPQVLDRVIFSARGCVGGRRCRLARTCPAGHRPARA